MTGLVITPICTTCGESLTRDEFEHYTDRCEDCEQDWHARITQWRAGGDDPELDRLYRDLTGGIRH